MSDYIDDLLSDLKDPEYAAEYLTAARRESRETFLLALRDVAEAQKGMTKVAAQAGVNRENLYRMLSEGGNPRLSSLDAVLAALGIEAEFRAVNATPRPNTEIGGGASPSLHPSARLHLGRPPAWTWSLKMQDLFGVAGAGSLQTLGSYTYQAFNSAPGCAFNAPFGSGEDLGLIATREQPALPSRMDAFNAGTGAAAQQMVAQPVTS
ncbi:MAG: addiction module antidote protein [Bryobacteraceae bacterium]